MATNIQIKRGSGSNTPSSLLQGEMAVNMDTGQLYFGSGSTKTPVNSYKFTNVTASGDISASGTVSATSYTGLPTGIISGSSQLPSGIISGSSQLPSGLISGSGQLPSGIYSSSTQILGNITSSGDISSSGTISGLNNYVQETGSILGSLRMGNPMWGNAHARGHKIINDDAYSLKFSNASTGPTILEIYAYPGQEHVKVDGYITGSDFIQLAGTPGTHTGVKISSSNSEGDTRDAQMIVPLHGFEIKNSSNNNVFKISEDHVGINTQYPVNSGYALSVSGSSGGGGAISAIGDISSSGHVSASSFIGSGSQILGIVSASYALTASHALNGGGGSTPAGTVSSSAQIVTLGFAQTSSATNVTFGNISSSGAISGSVLRLANQAGLFPAADALAIADETGGTLGLLYTKTTNVTIGTSTALNGAALGVNGNIYTNSHITASGNISASGTGSFDYLQTPTIEGSGSTALLHIDGNISASGYVSASAVNAITYEGSGSGTVVDVEGQISASGNISGSNLFATANISASDLYLTGGDIDLKNSGAQSNIKFYCETSNAHHTKLQAAPHSAYSGNPTTTLPAYTFDFSKPNFVAQITASGDVSASGHVSASSFIGSGSQILGIVSSSYALTASHALNAGGGAAGTVSSSAQIEDLGFELTSSVEVALNFEAATTYHYIVPRRLKFDGFATSSVFTATFSSSGASYTFGNTLNQFSVLHITASAAGLILLSGSRL